MFADSDEVDAKAEASLEFYVMDNPHWHRIAALVQALVESETFGKDYAAQVVKNAQALARKLDEAGFPVRYRTLDYTRSHQVLVDTDEVAKAVGMDYEAFANRLEEANIIVDTGGRLGAQELTRWGMKENEMAYVAELISRILDGESPECVREDALGLKKQFGSLRYVF
jgi:glycine hydroxymethyltransferase